MISATIPEAEIGDLIVELRSATAGVGTFSTRFDHMAELSGKPAEAVHAQVPLGRSEGLSDSRVTACRPTPPARQPIDKPGGPRQVKP